MAPAGYDLGIGSIRMYPPYHSGYLITVGSEYSVTAIGRLLDHEGKPVALLAGSAAEVGTSKHAPVIIFTNREGAFAATGLRPGQWTISMPTKPGSVYRIDIPAKAKGVVRLGDEKPEN
jgi:outer membrane usher protein